MTKDIKKAKRVQNFLPAFHKEASIHRRNTLVGLANMDLESAKTATPTKSKSCRPKEISPSRTESSSPRSPTFSDREYPSPTHTLSIEHNFNNSGGGSSGARSLGLILGMAKPTLIVVSLILLMTTGAAAYFLTGWLGVPSLKNQIDALQNQVGRLQAENDRYAQLNARLNTSIAEFTYQNNRLNMTANRLEVINEELNATNLAFEDRIQELTQQNADFEASNMELNATALRLTEEVNRFQRSIADLVLKNAELAGLTNNLTNLTGSLSTIAQDQNATVAALAITLTDLTSQNSQLQNLNNELTSITSFLNTTSVGLGSSLEQVTQFLASQITADRVLVLNTLQNTYLQRVANWDCEYQVIFRSNAFGSNFSLDIPDSDVASVMTYIDGRVLSELCLSQDDFQKYMFSNFPTGFSSNNLIAGVQLYTTAALDYYFPTSGQVGLTAQDWVNASFDCANLPNKFVYGVN